MKENTAVATVEKQVAPVVQARQAIEQIAPRFTAIEGLKLQFDKELGFAVQALKKNSYLLDIALRDKTELQAAIFNVALTGLSLNPVLKYAYLLPRSGKICLEPSYIGLIKILTDAGSIKQIWADVIREGDHSRIERGTNPTIEHSFEIDTVRGDIKGVYACAKLSDGTMQFEVLQTVEVEKIKQRSEAVKSGKSSPWDTDESEMYKKTAIRRLFKYLPKTEISVQALETLQVFDTNNAIEDEPHKTGIKHVNESKEKTRLLAFLERTNSIEELTAKRAEFERHGLTDALDGKIADLMEYLSKCGTE